MKHSRMGIASFVMSLMAWILVLETYKFWDDITAVNTDLDLFSWLLFLSLFGFMVALGLGVAGLI